MVNKKGQVGAIWGIMLFLFIMTVALTLMPSMREIITGSRTELSCGSNDLTTGGAFACIFVDILQALFFIALLLGALALLTSNTSVGV